MNSRTTRNPATEHEWPSKRLSFEEILNGGDEPTTTQEALPPDLLGSMRYLILTGVLTAAGLITCHVYHGAFTASEVSIVLGQSAACILLMPHRSERGAADGALAAMMTAVAGCLLGIFCREIAAISPWTIVIAASVPLPVLRVPRRTRSLLLGGFLLVGLLDVALVWAGVVGPWGLRGESLTVGVVAIIIAVSCRPPRPDAELNDVDQSPIVTWDKSLITWGKSLGFIFSRVWIFVEIATLLGLIWG